MRCFVAGPRVSKSGSEEDEAERRADEPGAGLPRGYERASETGPCVSHPRPGPETAPHQELPQNACRRNKPHNNTFLRRLALFLLLEDQRLWHMPLNQTGPKGCRCPGRGASARPDLPPPARRRRMHQTSHTPLLLFRHWQTC